MTEGNREDDVIDAPDKHSNKDKDAASSGGDGDVDRASDDGSVDTSGGKEGNGKSEKEKSRFMGYAGASETALGKKEKKRVVTPEEIVALIEKYQHAHS